VWLLARCLKLLVIWLIGAGMLGWARLPAAWRSRLALLASATGIVCLVLGMNSEGSRQSPTMAVVLMGTPYVTGQVSASASLYYYLLTVVCLLLGSLGLILGDPLASWLRRRWFLAAVAVSLLVTAVRFLLEKAPTRPGHTPSASLAGAPGASSPSACARKARAARCGGASRGLRLFVRARWPC
jgi:hypothetical protein